MLKIYADEIVIMSAQEEAEIEAALEVEFLRAKWARKARARRLAKIPLARIDADRRAQPKTRLVAHVRPGDCIGPFTRPFALEDVTTGERTKLG